MPLIMDFNKHAASYNFPPLAPPPLSTTTSTRPEIAWSISLTTVSSRNTSSQLTFNTKPGTLISGLLNPPGKRVLGVCSGRFTLLITSFTLSTGEYTELFAQFRRLRKWKHWRRLGWIKRGHGGERTLEYIVCRDTIENNEFRAHGCYGFSDDGDGDGDGGRQTAAVEEEGYRRGLILSNCTVLRMNQWRSFK